MLRLRALVAFLVVASVSLAQPPTFISAPTVVSQNGHQVLVAWVTSISATSELAWGPSSATTFAGYPNLDVPTASVGQQHSRTLRRLGPGMWFFRVRSTNGPDSIESAEMSVTVPAAEFPLGDSALDGRVNAIVNAGGTFQVGGAFVRKWPLTGSFVSVDRMTGATSTRHFPEFAGMVRSATVDSSGRIYVCGAFGFVGGEAHPNLVRLTSDGNLDRSFTVTPNDIVNECLVVGNTLYLGGAFTAVDLQSRFRVAAVDLVSGLVTAWNPGVLGSVAALAGDGTTVWVGGEFSGGLMAFSASSGTLVGSFIAPLDSTPRELLLNAGTLYIAGPFNTVGGVAHPRLAAVNAATGALLPFDAGIVGAEVSTIALSGSTLYLGGLFTSVGGAPRSSVAAVDAVTGAVQPFAPTLTSTSVVSSIMADPTGVLMTGLFPSVNGMSRRNAASLTPAGTLSGFDPDLSGQGLTLVATGSTTAPLFIGGSFAGANGSTAVSRFLRMGFPGDTTNGPSFGGTIFSLGASASEVYAAGFFGSAGGQMRSNLAAMPLTGTTVTPWAPVANQAVHALKVGNGIVYLGGDFTTLESAPRNNAGAVFFDGGLASWDPSPSGSVETMHLSNGTVFLGGTFTSLDGGIPRRRLAAIDLQGNPLPWAPDVGGTVYAIESTPSAVYVGGNFLTCNSTTRSMACAFDAQGALLPWNPRPDLQVNTFFPGSDVVWLGGNFNKPDFGVASVDVGAGNVFPMAPASSPTASVRGFALDCTVGAERLAIGGSFLSLGAAATGNLAIVDGRPLCLRLVGGITLDSGVDAGVVDAGAVDAGLVDAGVADAGVDAGSVDAGADAGMDAGIDAGADDAGADGGDDAGLDAGADGGADAGDDAGLDAGVDAGPGPTRALQIGCGCESGWTSLMTLAALLLRRRRR